MTRKIIPIMHCFDNNYVIPAGIAFLSLLEHANPEYDYKLYVLHTDITPDNQEKLQSCVTRFKNASLEFINMDNKFDNLFSQTTQKAHYSKEMYYKFLAPSLFPQYDTIVIADVDVVYLGDISAGYLAFEQEDDYYLAGVKAPRLKGSWLEYFSNQSYAHFTPEERQALMTGAGYWIFNLKKMRADKCEEKFIDYALKNADKIRQPEQDTVNIICYPKIKLLPLQTVVCTFFYDLYNTPEALDNDMIYSRQELQQALDNPIQLHYATSVKPWNMPDCTKSEIWYAYLAKTPFFKEQMKRLEQLAIKNYKAKFEFAHLPLVRIFPGETAKLFGLIRLKKREKRKKNKVKQK